MWANTRKELLGVQVYGEKKSPEETLLVGSTVARWKQQALSSLLNKLVILQGGQQTIPLRLGHC